MTVVKNFLQESLYDTNLQEVGTTTIKLTKDSKRKRLAGAASLMAAKKANDPLYAKYKKLRAITLLTKKKLMLKYGRIGAKTARETIK